MIEWVTIFCLIAISHGAPLDDESSKNMTEQKIVITTLSSITNDVEGFAISDEILPLGSKKPAKFIVFLDIPGDTETELGASVLLPCRTVDSVTECQWSWQPLTPTHLPFPNTSERMSSLMNVRSFPAFGNKSNDCSVRFSSMKYEQVGFWTCAARKTSDDSFTATKPAKLSISNIVHETGVSFEKSESAIEAAVGSSAQITCKTEKPVHECQWSWRQLNQSQQRNLEVKKFPAFGNDSNDCSIKFKNVLLEQEGLWTCGARINDSFIRSSPVKFLISEVEFVQLSRGIQIAAGESALLRCLVNKPVMECEWSWRSTNTSGDSTVSKKFRPNMDSEHDCSIRFKHILHEEEGLWTCGIRLSRDGFLHEAPPATVTLLPSAKVNFAESPENALAQIGTRVNLKCVTSSRVEKCTWLWRPLIGDTESMVIKEFPSSGDLGRDCSLNIPRITIEEQGFWSCQVFIPSVNTILTSSIAKLTVYEQDTVKFSELSKDIQISSGGSVLLRCVTISAVEQCRWSLTPINSNTTVVVKQFSAAGDEARDCSVRLSHALAEQEGLWTCGAKIYGQGNYTDAPSANLSLLQAEPVVVAIWSPPHQKVLLACKVKWLPPDANCQWIHEPDNHIEHDDVIRKDRRNIQLNVSTGICTVQLNPNPSDLGLWVCKFSVKTESGYIDLGNSSIVLFNTRVGWYYRLFLLRN